MCATTTGVTVTARDVRELRRQPGNPHVIPDSGGGVWVVPADYYHAHLTGHPVVITGDDLDLMDPDANGYPPDRLAALLTDYATHTTTGA